MKCPRCQHENRPGAKFCEEFAAPLARACVNCGAQLSAAAKFCSECAHPAGPAAPLAPQRFGAPAVYTPKHLAERIINSKAAVEGERKQVTVLFADLKGSMELLADRDTSKSAPRHWAWAALMRRAFDLDVLACPRCRGRLRLIATVEDPEAIRAILAALAGSRDRAGRAPPGAAGEPP